MKKLFTVQVFLLISILFGNATLAQITITSTDVAATNALGNVITNNFDSLATFIDIGSPGATSWDFSTLKSNYTNTFTSVTPSSAPYHSSHFPNSNVVFSYKVLFAADTVDSWQYTTQNASDYLIDGSTIYGSTSGSDSTIMKSVNSPPQLYFPLPFTFNDQWNSDYANFTRFDIYYDGYSYVGTATSYHTETVKVDAWGDMKMPGGVIIPALRLRSDDRYTSSNHSYYTTTYSFLTKSGDMVGCTAIDTTASNSGTIQTNGVNWRTSNINDVKNENLIPNQYSLGQNFPNPFNPSTKIRYSIPHSSNVVIKVFDILGNEIETLVNEEKPIGTYEITWKAVNLPSGIYFYKINSRSYIETKKMILLK